MNKETLRQLREKFNQIFNKDTANPGTESSIPSAGHCAVVSAVLYNLLGGELISTYINNESHWFNRFNINGEVYDVDLTGDQFGFSAVQIKLKDQLYQDVRIRQYSDLNEETQQRIKLFMKRLEE